MPADADVARGHASCAIYDLRMPSRKRVATPTNAAAARVTEVSAPAARVLRRFRQVFNSVKSHFHQVEKRAGIGGAQLWALSIIRANPRIGVNGLARAMDIHQSTASNLVRALVASEMVVAERRESDRRAVQLCIRPAGTRVLRRAPGPFTGVLPDALERLDARTLGRLERDLARLIEVLHADKRAAGIPLAHM
jgi:DNA-binding MarR family transcriptional regulator